MTGLELERLARDVVPPVGATQVVAVVDHEPGARLQNGYPSGIGGRTRYGVAWLVDGVATSRPIALFDRQADALHLVGILNGTRPASRGGLDTATPVARRAVADPVRPEVPATPGASLVAVVCAGCGGPLPGGLHGQRRTTCSAACRQRARRHGSAEEAGAGTGSGETDVTPSRASEPGTTDPTYTARVPARGTSAEQLALPVS